MKIIHISPNQSGAYAAVQSTHSAAVPPGMAMWPDELSTDVFYEYNGFVTLTVEDIDGIPTATACEPNMDAWEAWRATVPEETATAYVTTETQKLRADIDYLSMMTGVDLPT